MLLNASGFILSNIISFEFRLKILCNGPLKYNNHRFIYSHYLKLILNVRLCMPHVTANLKIHDMDAQSLALEAGLSPPYSTLTIFSHTTAAWILHYTFINNFDINFIDVPTSV